MNAGHARLDEALAAVTEATDRATLAGALCAAAAGVAGSASALLATVDGGTARELVRFDRDAPTARLSATDATSPAATADGRAVTAFEVGHSGTVLLVDGRLAEPEREAVQLLVELAVATAGRLHSAEQLRVQQTRLRTLSTEIRTLESTPAFPATDAAAEFAVAASGLTERERDILENILQGASNAVIADIHTLSIETVKTHVKHILRKMGAANRAELIARSG
ncbi:LuxR C-terminal-related transcriptional regulator [Nocardia sp. NPDC050799]|uniref:response regulator transcription factor n=1 Tax=Nocardia sp. NPDC050799 TaxID=3154842 RepID=UPI0033D08CFA